MDIFAREGAAVPFLSAIPLYEAADGTQSGNIFELAKRTGAVWQWNERAIANLALYGHTLGSQALCAGISRQSAAFTKIELAAATWDVGSTFDDALTALKASFIDCIGDARRIRLSLSAGYDSRLLLALCLSYGIRPQLSVMGTAQSTDVVAATEISRRCGLPLQVIEIVPSDYFNYGTQIASDTSGCKLALHWHTWLYAEACEPADVHLVGSNGEFARSFYFDRPGLNPAAAAMPPSALALYWWARLARRSLKFSRRNPFARKGLLGAASDCRISPEWRAANLPAALDAFYAEQRVRHLIGSGLACYARFSAPRSPFLDGRWITAIASLPRKLKQGSSFHHRAIEALRPELNQLPYNRLPNGANGSGYAPLEQVLSDGDCRQIIADSVELDQFASRADRLAIMNDRNCRQDEERAFWLTLHYASCAQSQV